MRSWRGIRTIVLAVAALAVTPWARGAHAQAYPDHPIKMIVSFPAGGGADVLVRILTKHMTESLGQPFVVENHPGAGGAIAFAMAARAAPDGYTLAWTTAGYPVMAATIQDLGFDANRAFVHICDVAENPFVLVVNPKVEAKSVSDLIALAKARPDKLNFANNGNGTLTNLAVELLKLQTGIKVTQIPYRGDNFSIADVLAGNVDAMFSNAPVALPRIQADQLRGLAVTGQHRSPSAPQIPTMAEAGVPDFSVVVWQGFSAPAGTPRPIVDKLNAAARQAITAPEVVTRFKDLGAELVGSSPEQFQDLVRGEMTRWADVVRKSGVKLE
jgi:tripartite-type tricarboxylate transporter receptor subunit TctC